MPWRTETSTSATPEPESECEPQRPTVPQPAFQPGVEYSPPAAGKLKSALGSVVSITNERLDGACALPTASVARTRTV